MMVPPDFITDGLSSWQQGIKRAGNSWKEHEG